MSRAIEARECPIGVDEADDVGDARLVPAGVIDEGCEDEFRRLVRWSCSGDGDDEDCEAGQRYIEGSCGEYREDSTVGVEEEGHSVDELVGNNDVPGLDYTVSISH